MEALIAAVVAPAERPAIFHSRSTPDKPLAIASEPRGPPEPRHRCRRARAVRPAWRFLVARRPLPAVVAATIPAGQAACPDRAREASASIVVELEERPEQARPEALLPASPVRLREASVDRVGMPYPAMSHSMGHQAEVPAILG